MHSPIISVLMPVYNNQKYLQKSIESILTQTVGDYEFIIVNDGSTDSSEKIIKNYQEKDDRIILLTQENQGVTKSLNKGIKNCRGKYIARMDADDVCAWRRGTGASVL
ncbi:MAG TPA: glycosyltransferase family 2 protein [Nitrospinaceae bacterium]|nr:glycosyltransferase family 2 protein [Nitrospinaceae bacterium]